MNKHNTNNTTQAAWIGIGSLCSFLFSIVSAAILSRYLEKTDYGTYKQVMYVYSTLLSVFTLGLPLAYSYFLPRVDLCEGKALVNKLNFCFVVLGLLFSIFLFIGADTFATVLKNPELSKNIKVFSPAPILILPTMGLQGILATYKRTMLNAVYVIATRLLMLFFVVLPVVYIRPSVELALWGFNLASIISLVIALLVAKIPYHNIKKGVCYITYKEIFKYSTPLMFAGFLGMAINAADQFYVSRYFGQEVFADFANGSLELPIVGMVLNAGSVVLLPIFSKMISSNTQRDDIIYIWNRTIIKGAYIIYPILVFCIIYASEIMTIIYGEQYLDSAIYFQIMAIASFFSVVQFYPIILAIGKTKEYAVVHLWIFIIVWGMELLVVKCFHSPYFVTVVSVMCKICKMLLMMNIVSNSIGVNTRDLFPARKLIMILICSFLACSISYIVLNIISLEVGKLLIILLGVMIFIPLIIVFGRLFSIDFFSVIQPITDICFKKKCRE